MYEQAFLFVRTAFAGAFRTDFFPVLFGIFRVPVQLFVVGFLYNMKMDICSFLERFVQYFIFYIIVYIRL